MLGDTGNTRAVRILLKCILVLKCVDTFIYSLPRYFSFDNSKKFVLGYRHGHSNVYDAVATLSYKHSLVGAEKRNVNWLLI